MYRFLSSTRPSVDTKCACHACVKCFGPNLQFPLILVTLGFSRNAHANIALDKAQDAKKSWIGGKRRPLTNMQCTLLPAMKSMQCTNSNWHKEAIHKHAPFVVHTFGTRHTIHGRSEE